MRMRDVALLFCTALILGGCANGASSRLSSLLSASIQTESAPASGSRGTLYLGIVDALIKQGRQSAALAFLDGYSQSGEALSPRYWLLRGNALLGLGRNSEAAIAFAKLEDTPLAAHGWNGRGRIAAAGHDWATADQDFRNAVVGDPVNADFLNNLAFADMHLNRVDSAATWLQQAHELDPGSDRILTNLIIALRIKGDDGRADSIISGIKDGDHREALRALVRSAVATLNAEGKS